MAPEHWWLSYIYCWDPVSFLPLYALKLQRYTSRWRLFKPTSSCFHRQLFAAPGNPESQNSSTFKISVKQFSSYYWWRFNMLNHLWSISSLISGNWTLRTNWDSSAINSLLKHKSNCSDTIFGHVGCKFPDRKPVSKHLDMISTYLPNHKRHINLPFEVRVMKPVSSNICVVDYVYKWNQPIHCLFLKENLQKLPSGNDGIAITFFDRTFLHNP